MNVLNPAKLLSTLLSWRHIQRFHRAESTQKMMPGWLYQTLPFVYLLSGVVAIGYFESPLVFGAGVLLIFTAFLIWMRRDSNES